MLKDTRLKYAKKIGSYDMKQTDSSIIIVRNVCVLTSATGPCHYPRKYTINV